VLDSRAPVYKHGGRQPPWGEGSMSTPTRFNLRVMSGDLAGQAFPLDRDITIGRATTCDVFVPDRRASREHARLRPGPAAVAVEDLHSHNGTYVNNERVTEAALRPGDALRIGVTHFAIEVASPDESAVVRFVTDAAPVSPRLIRPVEPVSGPVDLRRVSAQDMFDALGVGMTERLDDVDVLPLLRKTRSFAILVEASKILQRYGDLRDNLPGLLDLVLQTVQGDRIAVLLLDERQRLVPKIVQARGEFQRTPGQAAKPPSSELVMSRTVCDMVMSDRCAVIIADAATDERLAGVESVIISRVRSLLAVPVLVGDRMLGIIGVENRRSVNAFDESDLHLLAVLGSMLGVALDHLEVSQARERAIADLRAAQDQLIATQQRLIAAERLGVLGRLSSGIAHEVRNHLSPFMLADMIARKYPQDQEIQEASELMIEAQQRIFGIVDEIRAFAGGARGEVTVQPCDLAQVLDGVLRFLRCDRVVRGADVRLSALARPIVPMDAARIRQVLINLIRNAAEAIEGRHGYVEVVLRDELATAVVEVCDNGPGIPAEIRERVFEPFFTTKGERGLGLGLDVSRQIARAHGGTLSFDTEVGVGTVFRLALPKSPSCVPPEPDSDDVRTDPNPSAAPLGQ